MESRIEMAKEKSRQQYNLIRARQRSPSYVQSRRFHAEQFLRDNQVLGQISSLQPAFSALNHGHGSVIGSPSKFSISSGEGCRLTNNFCAYDHQCCSGKCRCTRWSITGKMSCWKKCF